jgi:hypothetical protein
LSLLADSPVEARIRAREVELSTVIAESLSDGLRSFAASERSEEVLRAYRKAFDWFSDREMLILNGVLPDSIGESGR